MNSLSKTDPDVARLLESEKERQQETLMMIPSENHTSQAIRRVVGSCFQDKYCEGYPFQRYYQGQENFDKLEQLCQERVKKMFRVPYCNVQPLSGSPANSAVYFALLKPGDKIMGLRLDQGGHISHGLKLNFSGKFFNSSFYGVGKDGLIDYDELEKRVVRECPKILIAGITSYSRTLNFVRFAQIADKCGAWLMADIAHVSGLVLSDIYPDPVPHCHIVTTTTHKTLRGPRGALIMVTDKGLARDPELGQKIDKAVFPGLQGGPHENNIAGIAVALKEADTDEFKQYGHQIVKNAQCLADNLMEQDIKLCSDGTNTHLLLIDLQPFNILGNTIAEALEKAGIVCNRNSIPYDPNPPFYPSGIRLGTPAVTSRGMKEKEMEIIAGCIARVIKAVAETKKALGLSQDDEKKKKNRQHIISKTKAIIQARQQITALCQAFPLPSTTVLI